MSQSRGKSKPPPTPAAADAKPPTDPPHSVSARPSPLEWCLAAGAGLATAIYLLIFFWQDLLPEAERSYQRFLIFTHLLTPDDLALDWVDGSWRNFAVLDRLLILLPGTVLLALALLFGAVSLWTSRGLHKTTLLERNVFRIGLGLQVVSLLALLGGMLGYGASVPSWLFQALIYSILMPWLLSRFQDKPAVHAVVYPPPFNVLASDTSLPSGMLRASEWLLTITLVVLSLLIVLGAMLPPWDFDVREYHLQVPKEWSQQGRIVFLPHNVYGNMPLGAEMHAYAAMVNGGWERGALIGKLVMACYGPLTALLLYAAGRRCWSKLAGLAAAVVFLSNPWVIHVCVNGLNESALAFYLLAALYATFLGGKGRPCAGLAGFLAGAAASCKYTGVLFVIFPLLLVMLWHGTRWSGRWHDPRSPQKLRWRPHAAIFLLMAAMSCGLWYGKSAVLTGNPVYPLMSSMLNGKTRTPEKTAQWNQAHRTPPYSFQDLAEAVGRIAWKDTFQSPLMVPLSLLGIAALVSVARKRRSPASSTLNSVLDTRHSLHVLAITTSLLLFFLAAWWLFTHRLDRFLVPAITLAALLAGAGVELARTRPLKYVVAGLMVFGLTYNVLMAASPIVGDNRWFVSLERLRTDVPRREGEISRVKAAHRWLNENVKPGQAVLCVADAAVFDLEMPSFYNTCFDDCLLVNWIEGKTAVQRREEFRSRNVAFVYFDQEEFERYISPGNYGYDPRFSPKLLDELVSQGVLKRPLTDAPPHIYPVVP